jgi:hypothetical protein
LSLRRSLLLQFGHVHFLLGLLRTALFGQPRQAALQTVDHCVVHERPGRPNDFVHDANLGTGNDFDRRHGHLAFSIELLVLLQIEVVWVDGSLGPAHGVGEHQAGRGHVAVHGLVVEQLDQRPDLRVAQRLRGCAAKSGGASGKGIPRSPCISTSEPTAPIAAIVVGGWR